MIPIRHTIGANLMAASRLAEAKQFYHDDLKRLPENRSAQVILSASCAAKGGGRAPVHTREIRENMPQSGRENNDLLSISIRIQGEL
jgi:hypothetical protein